MRSSPTRGSGRHALTALPASVPGSARAGAARVAVVTALVLATGSLVACAVGGDDDGGPGAPAAVVFAPPSATATAGVGREVASRSEVRAPVPRTVSVAADGATRELSTTAETVGDVLAEAGIAVGAHDLVEPALTDPAAETIRVSRVTFADGVDREEIPFTRTERDDASLERGVRRVEVAGVTGVQTVVFQARIVDGHEVSREEVLRTVVAPVAEIVRVGTKVPATAPAPTRTRTSSSSGSRSSAAAAAPASGPVVAGDPRSIGRTLAAARGWGADQFACLDALWTKESNWNPYAQNRSSGAYGIPQALPGSKMGTVAADWRTNPTTQITWGLNYIGGRYGSPCAAWAHSQARNWY